MEKPLFVLVGTGIQVEFDVRAAVSGRLTHVLTVPSVRISSRSWRMAASLILSTRSRLCSESGTGRVPNLSVVILQVNGDPFQLRLVRGQVSLVFPSLTLDLIFEGQRQNPSSALGCRSVPPAANCGDDQRQNDRACLIHSGLFRIRMFRCVFCFRFRQKRVVPPA